MDRIKEMKEKEKEIKQSENLSLQARSRAITRELIMMTDPYVKNKYFAFQKLEGKATGPSFLHRMEKDVKQRNFVGDIIKDRVQNDQILDLAR